MAGAIPKCDADASMSWIINNNVWQYKYQAPRGHSSSRCSRCALCTAAAPLPRRTAAAHHLKLVRCAIACGCCCCCCCCAATRCLAPTRVSSPPTGGSVEGRYGYETWG
eukprot:4129127-Prymnesium_polylepis.1